MTTACLLPLHLARRGRSLRGTLLAGLLLAGLAPVRAQMASPPASAAQPRSQALPGSASCHEALQALSQAEDALAAEAAPAASAASADGTSPRPRTAAERLYPWRQRVADACLGGLTRSPPPSQHTAVGLPPAPGRAPAPLRPPLATLTPVPVVTVPLPRIDPPVTLNHCTGTTCLASDGTTLTRVGPSSLVGPRGLCTTVGTVVRCP